jgi:hypothetical protein
VATDAAGNVFVVGSITGTVNFGGGNLVSAGASDAFVAKFGANGSPVWSQRFGSTSVESAAWVAVEPFGDVVATGYFSGTVNFGGGNLVSAGGTDIFLAKYTTNGAHLWSQRFGGSATDISQGVHIDAARNVFVTGYFNGTVDFGGGNLVSQGSSDLFLAKYAPTGTHVWSQRFGGASADYAATVVSDASGGVLVGGYYTGAVDFGGGNLPAAGGPDAFVASYDAAGAHRWSRGFGDVDGDNTSSLAIDAVGDILATGSFRGFVDFGGGTLIAGSAEIFLAKFSALAPEPAIVSILDVGNDQGRHVRIRFERSGADHTNAAVPVTRYVAFRRVDPPPSMTAATASPSSRTILGDGWEQVGSVDAFAEELYTMGVPTIGDSTEALGQYYSTFFVRAATDVPAAFFDSAPDSGWSVDNLAPGVPGGLLYSSGQLSWNESAAEDFDYFTVYGANTDDFGTATVVDYAVDPEMDVTASPYAHYFVTATDFSGNEGKPAKVNTLSGAGGTPRSYVLSLSNHPNPFNPRTTLSYTTPARGHVTVTIHDARGGLVATLVSHEEHDAGAYRIDWDARAENGATLPSGIYFARIVHDDAVRSRKMVLLK